MTYIELVNKILETTASHKMVNESIYTSVAKINEMAKPGRKYFLCALISGSSPILENVINYSFTLICMDIISKTENNILQIQSDCIGVLNDIFAKLNFDDDIPIINQPNIIPFEENYGDFCAGAAIDIIIEVDAQGACLLPFNS